MNPPHAEHGEGDQPQAGGGAVRNAGRLRREMSLPEVMLWQHLRRGAGGMKFRRQHPIAGYVVDFYCPAAKLVVEVEGEAHDRGDRPARDERRIAALKTLGLTIMRIGATDVLQDAGAVAASVASAAWPLHRPSGGPPPHALRGEDIAGAA